MAANRFQLQLPPADVAPRPGLPADPAVNPNRNETHGLVQPDAGLVGESDSGAGNLKSLPSQPLQEFGVEPPPVTLSALPFVHVDRDISRPAIGSPEAMRTSVR